VKLNSFVVEAEQCKSDFEIATDLPFSRKGHAHHRSCGRKKGENPERLANETV
jgi:hypothetical protein